jgi:hypothetical protein
MWGHFVHFKLLVFVNFSDYYIGLLFQEWRLEHHLHFTTARPTDIWPSAATRRSELVLIHRLASAGCSRGAAYRQHRLFRKRLPYGPTASGYPTYLLPAAALRNLLRAATLRTYCQRLPYVTYCQRLPYVTYCQRLPYVPTASGCPKYLLPAATLRNLLPAAAYN